MDRRSIIRTGLIGAGDLIMGQEFPENFAVVR
mgnify:FL=1